MYLSAFKDTVNKLEATNKKSKGKCFKNGLHRRTYCISSFTIQPVLYEKWLDFSKPSFFFLLQARRTWCKRNRYNDES